MGDVDWSPGMFGQTLAKIAPKGFRADAGQFGRRTSLKLAEIHGLLRKAVGIGMSERLLSHRTEVLADPSKLAPGDFVRPMGCPT